MSFQCLYYCLLMGVGLSVYLLHYLWELNSFQRFNARKTRITFAFILNTVLLRVQLSVTFFTPCWFILISVFFVNALWNHISTSWGFKNLNLDLSIIIEGHLLRLRLQVGTFLGSVYVHQLITSTSNFMSSTTVLAPWPKYVFHLCTCLI